MRSSQKIPIPDTRKIGVIFGYWVGKSTRKWVATQTSFRSQNGYSIGLILPLKRVILSERRVKFWRDIGATSINKGLAQGCVPECKFGG